jgi:hypothetical protein
MATAVKTVRTLVAAGTTCSVGTPTRGGQNFATALGGSLTFKVTNGTAPTVGCTINVLEAHNASLPTLASAGVDWKTIYSVTAGITASTIYEFPPFVFGPEVMNLEVEFTGNATNAVTVEAFVSEITSLG